MGLDLDQDFDHDTETGLSNDYAAFMFRKPLMRDGKKVCEIKEEQKKLTWLATIMKADLYHHLRKADVILRLVDMVEAIFANIKRKEAIYENTWDQYMYLYITIEPKFREIGKHVEKSDNLLAHPQCLHDLETFNEYNHYKVRQKNFQNKVPSS